MGVVQTSIASYNPGIVDMSPPTTFSAKSNFFWKLKIYEIIKYITRVAMSLMSMKKKIRPRKCLLPAQKMCERRALHVVSVSVFEHIEER